ncbi:hypothetical protein LKM00_26430 [Bacillus wiedmannii]|uniref:hypothetical protein n=1 Tax=Bacillus wiedmannii TaxID=1890302 RepID=UPI001E41AC82|nr:hypothetical protein [Bacillus wiedmannii]MCC2380937.1 hypothetical protein [Bacillus wiedmannii]MCC2425351.1 hypothetical protein [Bacillus wiedmannii]
MVRKKKSDNEKTQSGIELESFNAIDQDTGEIKGRVTILKGNAIILDPEEERKRKDAQKYRNKTGRVDPFVQCTKEYKVMIEDYNRLAKECLVKLFPYIGYKDSIVKIDDKIASTSDIYDMWGVSNKTGKLILDKIIADGILIEEESGFKSKKQYRCTGKTIFRGKNNKKDFTQKINDKALKFYIDAVQKKLDVREKTAKKNKKKISPIYPLALFAALIPHFSYDTYILCKNNSESIILEHETVTEILASRRKRSRFQFLKTYELWNIYSGQNLKNENMSSQERKDIKECMDILLKVGVLGLFSSHGKILYLINPNLVYSSPGFKCDAEWIRVIDSLFKFTK